MNVCSDVKRGHQKSADAVVGMKRALQTTKPRRSHERTEGLNVKMREQIAKYQRESVKPNHVRELLAGG